MPVNSIAIVRAFEQKVGWMGDWVTRYPLLDCYEYWITCSAENYSSFDWPAITIWCKSRKFSNHWRQIRSSFQVPRSPRSITTQKRSAADTRPPSTKIYNCWCDAQLRSSSRLNVGDGHFLALLVRLHSPIECYRCLRSLYWGVPGGARSADRVFGDKIFCNFLDALPQMGRAVILCESGPNG